MLVQARSRTCRREGRSLSEQAYQLCVNVAASRKGWLGKFSIDFLDAAHDAYLACLKRGGFDRSLVLSRAHFATVDSVKKAVKQPAPYDMSHQEGEECFQDPKDHDFDSGLEFEEVREWVDGQYPGMVDAYIKSNGDQKAAGKLLGLSQPAMSQRLKKLREAYNA